MLVSAVQCESAICTHICPPTRPLSHSSRPSKSTRLSSQCYTAAAKSLQLRPTLCDPRDGSPPGSAVPGILQARTLEWVAISFSSAWKWKVKVKSLSRVWLFTTPWTAAYQAPPSMGFSMQEYWSGVPLPSPCATQQLPTILHMIVYICQCYALISSHFSFWPHSIWQTRGTSTSLQMTQFHSF